MHDPTRLLAIIALFSLLLLAGCGPSIDSNEAAAYAALAQLGAEMDLSPEGRIASVELSRTDITDDDLRHLDQLTHVWCVSLYDTKITDEGLKHLAHLDNLKWLDVENTAVTSQGLRELAQLRKIVTIWVGGTNITDEEIAELQRELPTTVFRR